MNENQKVMNALQNYFAITHSKIGILSQKERSLSEENEFLLMKEMESLLLSLLNNDFSVSLYKNASSVLVYLAKVKLGVNTGEPMKLIDSAYKEYGKTYLELIDSFTYFDAKHLRKNDPIEAVMRVVVLFAQSYSNCEVLTKEELAKNRYDVIFNKLMREESFGQIYLKMTIKEANVLSVWVKKLHSVYKDNVVIDSIITIKNLIYDNAIMLLFKKEEEVTARYEDYLQIILPLLALLDEKKNLKDQIAKLSIYVDMVYSKKHQIPLSNVMMNDLPRFLNYQYSLIDSFTLPNGFLLDENGKIPSFVSLEERYLGKLIEMSAKGKILSMDTILLKFMNKWESCEGQQLVFIQELSQLIEDKRIILNELFKKEN